VPNTNEWWKEEGKFEIIPVHGPNLVAQVLAQSARQRQSLGNLGLGNVLFLISSAHDFPQRPPEYYSYTLTVSEYRQDTNGKMQVWGSYHALHAPGTAHTIRINFCHMTIDPNVAPGHNQSRNIVMKVKRPRR